MRKGLPREWTATAEKGAPGYEADASCGGGGRGGPVSPRRRKKGTALKALKELSPREKKNKRKAATASAAEEEEEGQRGGGAQGGGGVGGGAKVSVPIRSTHRIHVDKELVWSPLDDEEGGHAGGGRAAAVAAGGGPFVLDEEPIGQGAFGKVFRATLRSGFQLAVKEVDLALLERMSLAGDTALADEIRLGITQEIDLLRQIVSPHVVQYYGSMWKEKNRLWILMEYCQAGSVRDLMEAINVPSLKEKHIAYVLYVTLQGLADLHQQTPPITHFDVKANNILITSGGVPKLADFGLARKIDDANVGSRPVAGTRYWMAPELFERGQPKAGPPADIWSLGITAIELAYGKPPYFDDGPMQAMRAIIEQPPPRLSDMCDESGRKKKWSSNFEDFVAQCLTKEPGERPTAKMLLHHPFVTNAAKAHKSGKQTVLQKSLHKRNKIMKKRQKQVKAEAINGSRVINLLKHRKKGEGNKSQKEVEDAHSETESEEERNDCATHDESDHQEGLTKSAPRQKFAGSSFSPDFQEPLLQGTSGPDTAAPLLQSYCVTSPMASSSACCCILF